MMKALKHIFLTLVDLLKQAGRFPQSLAQSLRQKRAQVVLNDLESERLDRIRNPSKYLGK